jgi:uncharacterized repeat protein (TIGR01451 family)
MKVGRGIFGVCFFLCAMVGAAAAKPQVSLHLTAFVLQQTAGHTTSAPLGSKPLQAGDRVRFVLEARNDGTSAALNLMPADQIPAHMSYVPGSAKDGTATVEFSLDGKHWSQHPVVDVKTAKGVQRHTADPSLYKAIRWVTHAPLQAHHAFTYSFEAQVNGRKAGAK